MSDWNQTSASYADMPPVEEIEEAAQSGDEEASLFVPLQWPQQLPRTYYKQSDPDWQEFVRMSNDEGRANAVRGMMFESCLNCAVANELLEELAKRCLKDVSRAPRLKQVLGENIQLGQYWLDLKYPDRPPPEYIRSGLEISDEYISWSTQTIPHAHYIQLRHVMYPKAIFSAAYTSISIFSQLQWIKVKESLGMEMNNRDKQLSHVSKIEQGARDMEAMKAQTDSDKDASAADKQRLLDQLKVNKDNGSPPVQPKLPSAAQTDPPSNPTSPASHPLLAMLLPIASGSGSDESAVGSRNSITGYLRPSADMTLAWKTFLATLQMSWSRLRLDTQPKGAFYVVGQVEIRGKRGRVRCDVVAAYDPKLARIVYCICQVKHYWEWQQRAKGGP